jgi:hypothetical protein
VDGRGHALVEVVELPVLRGNHAPLTLHAQRESGLLSVLLAAPHVYSTTPSRPFAAATTRSRVRQAMQ